MVSTRIPGRPPLPGRWTPAGRPPAATRLGPHGAQGALGPMRPMGPPEQFYVSGAPETIIWAPGAHPVSGTIIRSGTHWQEDCEDECETKTIIWALPVHILVTSVGRKAGGCLPAAPRWPHSAAPPPTMTNMCNVLIPSKQINK